MTMTEQPELFRTAGGGRLHIRPCPHIHGAQILAATPQDAETLPVCAWSAAELADRGRSYHRTFEEALADMGAPQHATAELARLLRLATYDGVFVPFSRSYVAVTLDGVIVAWAGMTYVDYRDRPLVTLPDYAPGGGGGVANPDRWVNQPTCPTCRTQRSVTGVCGCWCWCW